MQALDEFVGRDVDQHDVVGLLQDAVGNGLAHGDAGNARDDVGEALEMLDVERRPDVDAGVEQLLDVLPALGMAAFGSVGVRQLVDDDQVGLARERRVEVELVDRAAVVFDHAPRQDFEPFHERARLGAAVRLDEADDDVDALVLEAAGALQHGVGLADAGSGAEEDLQPAARPSRRSAARSASGSGRPSSDRLGWTIGARRLVTTILADPALNSAAKH